MLSILFLEQALPTPIIAVTTSKWAGPLFPPPKQFRLSHHCCNFWHLEIGTNQVFSNAWLETVEINAEDPQQAISENYVFSQALFLSQRPRLKTAAAFSD